MRLLLLLLLTLQGFAAFNLTWGTPAVSLDSNPPPGDTDGNAVIALDPMGNGVAIWGRTSGQKATEDIWAASYNHSLRTWTGATKISGGGNAINGRVAVDPEGNALFVWEEGFPTQILSRSLSADGVWTPDLSSPPTVVSESSAPQLFPQIKVDAQGNALAVWMEYKQGRHTIYSAHKQLNGLWRPLGRISHPLGNSLLSPTKTISMNGTGNALLVWEEAIDGGSSVWGALYSRNSWGKPFPVSVELGRKSDSPAVGIDEQGNGLFVWHEEGIIQSKTWIEGSLSHKITASDPAYQAIHPDVALDGAGNGVLVYERYNSLHKFITGTTLPFGASSWTLPLDISAPSPADAAAAGYPVLTLNQIGDGVVIWKEFTGTNRVIQGAGYSLGTWSSPKTLSSLDDNSGSPTPGYDISAGVNLAGHIIAVWPEDPSLIGSYQLKANAAAPNPITPPSSDPILPPPLETKLVVRLKVTVGTGLANIAPLPPLPEPKMIIDGIACGYQTRHKFPAHTDLINILSWSCSNDAAHYRIYRGNLHSLIGTSESNRFEDHQRIPKQVETYLITAVDKHGQESTPMTLVVQPR